MSQSQFIAVLGMVILISIFGTGAQICFKTSVEKLNLPTNTFREMLELSYRLLYFFRVWVGMWMGLVCLGLWLAVLGMSDLNLAFSLSSINYIFITLGSKFILNENIGSNRWLATLMIILGIAIVSVSSAQV